MAQLFWLSGQSLVDGTGTPYALAKAYFYETGTTTPKATYSNAGLSSANANPVVADSDGRFGLIYLVAGRYKIVLTDANDVQIGDDLDPVDGVLALISAASAPSPTYAFMRYHNTSDGNVYRRSSTNSSWISEGPVDGLGNAATVTQQLAGTATDAFSTPDSVAGLWQRGSDIASASTLSLPASGGGVFNVTGTTGITGISSAQGGRTIQLRFASGLLLTHNGTSFILPGAANQNVRAGDIWEFTNDAAQDASGSNWRATNVVYNNNVPLQAPAASSKTTNYTVTDADRGASIRFAGLSADATLTLPAAAGRAGFVVYLSNEDTGDATSYGVIVDPNSTELIDGLSTRKGYTGTRVAILCDGTGWRTVSGMWRYFSGDQTITSAGALTLAHGLGIKPQRQFIELKCSSAEFGYSVGDIAAMNVFCVDASGYGTSIVPDATNLNVRFANSAAVFQVLNKTTGAAASITAASWRVRFYAEA